MPSISEFLLGTTPRACYKDVKVLGSLWWVEVLFFSVIVPTKLYVILYVSLVTSSWRALVKKMQKTWKDIICYKSQRTYIWWLIRRQRHEKFKQHHRVKHIMVTTVHMLVHVHIHQSFTWPAHACQCSHSGMIQQSLAFLTIISTFVWNQPHDIRGQGGACLGWLHWS